MNDHRSEFTLSCGCRIRLFPRMRNGGDRHPDLKFCPLHSAAEFLAERLADVIHLYEHGDPDGQEWRITAAKEALRAAGVKP